MKIPVLPPSFRENFQAVLKKGEDWAIQNIYSSGSPVDARGRYLHWDKLRHLTPPEGLTPLEWWLRTKYARMGVYKSVPLRAINNTAFQFANTDQITRELHWLDRYASGSIRANDVTNDALTKPQTRDTYLINSLIEEAINSSQLEGASTTRDVAKEMIRQDRSPKDESEQMILNNYRAMQFIRDIKDEPLTPSIVFELHHILAEDTMPTEKIGGFRKQDDDSHVVDNKTQEYLHTPPDADQLPSRLQALCDFANWESDDENAVFLHPVIKAITLHFMLAYDHPFYDGNGRTARALFYWAMARQGYWLTEFISISKELQKAPAQYGQAFLYTETDDNDLTYFLIHQLEVIHKAVDALHKYLEQRIAGLKKAQSMLMDNPKLSGQLNFRQLALLRHALKHPRFSYVAKEHQQSHGISYDSARNDLLEMSDKFKLLIKTRKGTSNYFIVPKDLQDRIYKK